jgi:hypothetical protein
MFADRLFSRALRMDPQNARARFYEAVLRAPMLLKGIYKRVRPLAAKGSPWLRKSIAETTDELAPGGLQAFLLDAPAEDIDSEERLQAWIAAVRGALSESRQFMKNNKDLVLRLQFTAVNWGQEAAYLRHCPVVEMSPDVYRIIPCPFASRVDADVDRADIEWMQSLFAGAEAYAIVATAYGIDGLIGVERENNWHHLALTDRQIIQGALSHPGFGQLKAGHLLKGIPSIGADILNALRWARKVRAALCPDADPRGGNAPRPERLNHLLSVCLNDQMADGSPIDQAFDLLGQMIMGRAQSLGFRPRFERASPVSVVADFSPFAPFYRPIGNLREIAPTRYDRCDDPTEFADPTLGGIFPKGDAGNTLEKIRDACDEPRITRSRR